MTFLPFCQHASNAENIVLDDSDLSRCFKALVEGNGNVDVYCRDTFGRRLLDYIKENYIMVKAAGGVVVDENGRLLMMTRNGRADLPKGKVEEGETLLQAAIRETAEETGLNMLEPQRLLLKTYHIYNLYGGWHFKQTSWFLMRLTKLQPFVPQLDEGITEGAWLPYGTWADELNKSYATMRAITCHMSRLINFL